MDLHPQKCGHGKLWDEPCPKCEAAWLADRLKFLREQAAYYGFKLVPMDPPAKP